jgi:hypothetical protein
VDIALVWLGRQAHRKNKIRGRPGPSLSEQRKLFDDGVIPMFPPPI